MKKVTTKQGQSGKGSLKSQLRKVKCVAIDLGDRMSRWTTVDKEGEKVLSGDVQTTRESMEEFAEALPSKCRVAIEVGTHSRWVEEVLACAGHKVFVANTRKLKLIFGSDNKSDQVDAEALVDLLHYKPKLLHPIQHRSVRAQEGLNIVRLRKAAVEARTKLVNCVRGIVKASGARLPDCDPQDFHDAVAGFVPPGLMEPIKVMLESIQKLTQTIAAYDKTLNSRMDELAPAARALTRIHGVGTLTAVTFVLTVDDPKRFASSRILGSYLGMRPRRDQSGKTDKALPITKSGDPYLRMLLIQAAHHVLRSNAPDSDLRRWGLKLADRGGKIQRKRALVAVARKLAVLMHRLWVTGQPYDPLYQARQRGELTAKAA